MTTPEPGDVVPDLALPDHDGRPRRLADLPGGDPLVLHLYRGWFCPKERAFFRDVMLPLQDLAEVAYTQVVSVSVETPAVQAAYRAGLEARWTFLSDADRGLQQALDLREWTDTEHDPFVPTVLVLRPDLTVHRAWNGYWFWGRPSLDELWTELRGLTRDLREDWVVPRG